MKALLAVLLALLPLAGAGNPMPGDHLEATLWAKVGQRHVTELALYSLRERWEVEKLWWCWSSAMAPDVETTPTAIRVGETVDQGYGFSFDKGAPVIGLTRFTNQPPLRKTGTWKVTQGVLTFSFPDGESEAWDYNEQDPTLPKLELVNWRFPGTEASSKAMGWGFSSGNQGPNVAHEVESMRRDHSGYLVRFNAWSDRDEDLVPTQLRLKSAFHLTSTQVLRRVSYDQQEKLNVYCYITRISSKQSPTNRMVVWQISHDYDRDGKIDLDRGHIYCGLQVIDRNGAYRGMIFSDVSTASGKPSGNYTISSLVLLAQ